MKYYFTEQERKYYNYILLFFVLFVNLTAEAQFFRKILKKVKKITEKTKVISFDDTKAISTSIKDTLYGVNFFEKEKLIYEDAKPIESFVLSPGYYKTTIRSYCLKAGVYGPTKGDGYQIAKLKGNKSKIIKSILNKSVNYSNIPQSTVQTLIWGIEAGTKFSDYPIDFQEKVSPLLTKKEKLMLEINFDEIKDEIIPDKIKSLTQVYSSLRKKMQATQMKYDEIEEIAVKKGIAPLGIGSKVIHKGIWSYIGNGFFLRAFPKRYSTTDIEIYRPSKFDVIKDTKDRIVEISNNKIALKINYNDIFGEGIFDYGTVKVPVWKIKQLQIFDIEKSEDTIIDVDRWMFRGSWKEIDLALKDKKYKNVEYNTDKSKKGGPFVSDQTHFAININKDTPKFDEVYERFKKIKKRRGQYKSIEGFFKEVEDLSTIHSPEHYIKNADALSAEGVKAAVSFNYSKKGKWMRKHGKLIRDFMDYILCGMGGGCSNNDPLEPDLSSNLAQPGNTNQQRIGLSRYKK